ncbi:MAG TPA: tetratricopeptide repeat protein, partial [Cyclobacteriaceae bacterium]|nr:tetratricopeptide repeat protein [Cyclobacteriaceae bacterium]
RSQHGSRGSREFNTGTAQSTIHTPPAVQVVKRVMFTLLGLTLFMTVFFVVKGIVTQEDIQEQTGISSGEDTANVSDQDVTSLLYKGDDFFNSQQYDSAEVYYNKALELAPDNMQAVYGQGIVYYQTDRKEDAMNKFRTSYDGGNRFYWLSWVLADAAEKEGNSAQAINLYKEAIGMDSTQCGECYTRLAALEPENSLKYNQLAQKHASN